MAEDKKRRYSIEVHAKKSCDGFYIEDCRYIIFEDGEQIPFNIEYKSRLKEYEKIIYGKRNEHTYTKYVIIDNDIPLDTGVYIKLSEPGIEQNKWWSNRSHKERLEIKELYSAKKVVLGEYDVAEDGYATPTYICPRCKKQVDPVYKACPYCKQSLNWKVK